MSLLWSSLGKASMSQRWEAQRQEVDCTAFPALMFDALPLDVCWFLSSCSCRGAVILLNFLSSDGPSSFLLEKSGNQDLDKLVTYSFLKDFFRQIPRFLNFTFRAGRNIIGQSFLNLSMLSLGESCQNADFGFKGLDWPLRVCVPNKSQVVLRLLVWEPGTA